MLTETTLTVVDHDKSARAIGGQWQSCPVYDRLALPAEAVVAGPAVLEQPDTTVLIAPGQAGTVDKLGNIVISRGDERGD